MFFKKNPNHSRKKTSAKIWLFYYFEQFILISKDRPSVTFQAKNDTNNYLLKGHKELYLPSYLPKYLVVAYTQCVDYGKLVQ